MNTKQQGDVGVAMAIAFYTREGFNVSVPLTDNAKYDLLIEKDGSIDRVQCKTSKYEVKGAYVVQLATNGGNQSWSGDIKKISASEADRLFIYTFDGSSWELPKECWDGKANVRLGNNKLIYKVVW